MPRLRTTAKALAYLGRQVGRPVAQRLGEHPSGFGGIAIAAMGQDGAPDRGGVVDPQQRDGRRQHGNGDAGDHRDAQSGRDEAEFGEPVAGDVRARAEGVTTRGESYDQTYCFVFRVAEGKLREVVEYCDTALVERVLTRPA
ncbi:nuclear transport factor 2 family protein [Nocardia arthritidis]|uniref:nuclear transport factor 2 family protein n=1 Tax=Nocardia arthritidis TaxID=228602 RepID=UPI0007A41012|nr:hypothetical protein [Nocardia arthritidis]